jgi:iron complex outermembrane receptor protein
MGRETTRLNQHAVLFSSLTLGLLLPTWADAQESLESFLDLPIEDLLNIEVTSASKKKQRLHETATAIFVISQEDIRRAGVTSIPEALRMAPGLYVARIDANKWVVSSRGFSAQFANKLLVLVDGRSVYTPAYSGVYWDVQDTLLEDVERIEVIRGPGATLWGANAVNGVINIITKQAADTQGGLVTARAGNEEKLMTSLRYGAELNASTRGRFFIKYSERDSAYNPDTEDAANDDWRSLRGGFRLDGQPSATDSWTLQGDIYEADENQSLDLWQDPSDPASLIYAPSFLATNLPDEIDSSGWNLLSRWNHSFSADSSLSLQFYYDHTYRAEGYLTQKHDTLDLDLQHQIRLSERQELMWGLGYRRIDDRFESSFVIAFSPEEAVKDLYSAFIQDEIELSPDRLRLTLGTKLEHNDYTGKEIQPSARLLWLPTERQSLWASVSRAVRTPSRAERNIAILNHLLPTSEVTPPLSVTTRGSDDFGAERMLAYELGYRVHPSDTLSLDLALFYNDYENLQTFEVANLVVMPNPLNPLGPPLVIPTDFIFDNQAQGRSLGLELAVDWHLREWWRLQANYSYVKTSISLDPTSTDPYTENLLEGSSPRHQASLRSQMDLNNDFSLDLWVYHVDELRKSSYTIDQAIPAYTNLSTRLAWRPMERLEFSLVGHNLLDNRHPEFIGENFLIQTEVERSVYGQVRWSF